MKKRVKYLNRSDSNHLLKKVRACLECPICYSFMNGNIYQCAEGHSICQTCLPKCNTCPYCRQTGYTRNRILEDFLGDYTVSCHHQGCDHVCKRRFMQDHVNTCVFMPQKCPCCSDVIDRNVSSIRQHFEEKHGAKFSTFSSITFMNAVHSYTFNKKDLNKDLTWRPHIASMDESNVMILVHAKKMDDNIVLNLCHLNSPNETYNVCCEVKVWQYGPTSTSLPREVEVESIFNTRINSLSKFQLKPYLTFNQIFFDTLQDTIKFYVQLQFIKTV